MKATLHWRPLLLRVWRAAALAALGLLVWWQARVLEGKHRQEVVTLAEARLVFPAAAALSPAAADASHAVYDANGAPLGSVLRTAPREDHIVGYSGPNDVLLGLNAEGTVTGAHLLRSGDTPDHVAMIERDAQFLRQFDGWKPGAPFPKIAAVSGATLTSSAIAEAIESRLAGGAPSLRFPDAVTLEEVRALFPAAAGMEEEGGRLRVTDAAGKLLGFAVRTSPAADVVAGYRGPTESLVALEADGKTIAGLRLRRSYDNASYVQQVRDDEWYLAGFKGRATDDVAVLDFDKAGIEGVSGATLTSWAVAEGMKRTFAAPAARVEKSWRPVVRDWLSAAVACGALLMAFTRLRGVRAVRVSWQALLMAWALWSGGDLLTLALLGGWAQHGVPWAAAPGAALIAGVALFIPWAARRQIYCHHICPHGAAQQWLGKLRRRKVILPADVDRKLRAVPWLLLAAVPVMLLCKLDVAKLEPFDAWVWRAVAVVPLVIAVTGLVASVFIPQAYCRYGCPTGALLGFLRTSGAQAKFGRRDAAFVLLLLIAGGTVAAANLISATSHATTILRGKAMGTTWEVTMRGDGNESLQRDIAAMLEEIESDLSTWREDSAVSQFNASRSTALVSVTNRVAELTRLAAGVSEATGGAFDITAGPLVKLWGFGPAPRVGVAPTSEVLAAVRAHTGWKHLTVEEGTLRKLDPHTEIDLSAVGEGHAADEIAARLASLGVREFLINIGGELRARGAWAVAVEHPLRTLLLRDASLATAGTYRQQRETDGRRSTHLVDARTGQPVAHCTVSVSVRHDDCTHADAWATALNVLGREEGMPLAESLGLAAEFVEEDANGMLQITATQSWRSHSSVRQ